MTDKKGDSTPHGCTSFSLETRGLHPAALTDILTDIRDAVCALSRLAERLANETHGKCSSVPVPPASPSPDPVSPKPRTKPTPPRPEPAQESPILLDVINQLLVSKARVGRQDGWIRTLRCSLELFAELRGRRPIHTLTTVEIEDWVNGQEWSSRTIRNRLAHLQELWRFASARGWVSGPSPVLAVERPNETAPPAPQIHTPEQVRILLRAARHQDLSVMRHLAIRYFAGLRTAEAIRLTEANIRPHHIEVPGWAAKTRQRRLVDISPNLRAWLDLGGELPMTNEKRARWIAQRAQIEWPHNVTRHSWCSYHLAMHSSAASTSLQAGHSEAMLFRHYRAIVTREQAEEYWSILPL